MIFNSGDKKISVNFREFQAQDTPAIIDLIRDEYKSSYRKRELYSEENILHGDYKFYIAELDDKKIIGVLAYKPFGTACEITTGIILKEYRNFHIFRHFVKYVVDEVLRLENVSAMIGRSVMYHSISQHLMSEIGFKPCGFIFSTILMENFHHSYNYDDNIKHPHAVIIKRGNKIDAGKIFLPEEFFYIAQNVYKSIGVKIQLDSSENILSGESLIRLDDDLPQQNCNIFIDSIGADIIEKILAVENLHVKPFQTFNIFLNINDKAAITAYKKLREIGYFFAGFEPICFENEFMILHNPKNVAINFDTLSMTEEFNILKEQVRNCYEQERN